MAAIIDFTVTLNVETATSVTYRDFIQDIRRRLQYGSVLSHDRPLLRPQDPVPTRWFEVVLTTNTPDRAVTLRVRSDNLYIDGYRAQNVPQWSEFANSAQQHLFNGSRFLEFGCNYISLERQGGRRTDISLGRPQLLTAINSLFDADTVARRAQGLLVIIQMISEAVRFLTITDFVVTNWINGAIPTDQIVALENGWRDISIALLQQDNDSYGHFRFHDNDMGITSAVQAVAYIAILLYYVVPGRGPSSSRQLRMAVVNDGQAQAAPQYPIGRPLVEVFSVLINNIDEEYPGQLYGSITVTDGLSTQRLYNRDKSDYQVIEPGETIDLEGPSRAISAAGDFFLDLSLYDYDFLSPNDEIAQGQILWNASDPFNEYDKSHATRISGLHGVVTVDYIVLADACEALIEVILINGDGEDPANVYGTITASNGFGENFLFRRSSSDPTNVSPGEPIPLLRTSMAIARTNELTVAADLLDLDHISQDDEIAKGSVIFAPEIEASFNQTISGAHGQIEVRITWY